SLCDINCNASLFVFENNYKNAYYDNKRLFALGISIIYLYLSDLKNLMHGVVGLIMGTRLNIEASAFLVMHKFIVLHIRIKLSAYNIVIVVNLINLGVLILLKMNLRGSIIILEGLGLVDGHDE
ncbi:hypothetical protein ACJX0J_033586, partial [Zea mays]